MQFLFYMTGPNYYPHQKMRLQVCFEWIPRIPCWFPSQFIKNLNHMPKTTLLIILLIIEQSVIEFKGLSNS